MSNTFNSEKRPTCGDDKGRWTQLPDGRVQCPRCKTIRNTPRRRVCRTESEQAALMQAAAVAKRDARAAKASRAPSKPRPPRNFYFPTRLVLVLCWLRAMARWVRESLKARRWLIRSEAEYRRVRRICEGCDNWEPAKEQCSVCGCGGRSKVVLLNKLRIETETCPEGKW